MMDRQRPSDCARLIAVAVAAAAVGCGTTPTQTLDETEQFFLFEIEYASSWFPTWTGVVIDRDGNLVGYRREDVPWTPAEEDRYTRAELETKYAANAEQVATLDEETVRERFEAIRGVGDDFTDPNAVCADAGLLRYTAYGFDEAEQRYRPLLLRAEGDFPTQNKSEDAQELSAWLRTVLEQHPVDGLQPFQEGFCTP